MQLPLKMSGVIAARIEKKGLPVFWPLKMSGTPLVCSLLDFGLGGLSSA
jgi:hypothetical protein